MTEAEKARIGVVMALVADKHLYGNAESVSRMTLFSEVDNGYLDYDDWNAEVCEPLITNGYLKVDSLDPYYVYLA